MATYHFPRKSFASTLEFFFHEMPTLTGSFPVLCLLLADPAGGGVGVVLFVVDPAGDTVCLTSGGGVVCLDGGGVLTGVLGVEVFLGLTDKMTNESN